MPKLILRCNYLKNAPPSHLANYMNYISTREGVEKIDNTCGLLPATVKQKELIADILSKIEDADRMHEYYDYLQRPTRENATEFITQALENNIDIIAKKKNYIDYLANRPRVEKIGTHGLFSNEGESVVLSRVAEEAANHPGVIWTNVISLRREDAERLGYDSAAQWQALLRSRVELLCENYKIDSRNLKWYAAFHNESHHPHVHLVVYSTNPSEGYLSPKGIDTMRSTYAHDIFRQEFMSIYEKRTQQREQLKEQANKSLLFLVQQMQSGICHHEKIAEQMKVLSKRLMNTSGKKVYGYLKADVKAIVNGIVDESAGHHNAVFVGVDKEGNPRHIHKKGTCSDGRSFRMNEDGSDSSYGFGYAGSGNKLYVFEAPIDFLSFLTLYPKNWQKNSYIVLNGVSEHAMLQMLKDYSNLDTVVLCLDHDPAGIEACGRLAEILVQNGYRQIKNLKSSCKDWNEDLKLLHGEEVIPAQEHPKILECDAWMEILKQVTDSVDMKYATKESVCRYYQDIYNALKKGNGKEHLEDAFDGGGMLLTGVLIRCMEKTGRELGRETSADEILDNLHKRYRPHRDKGNYNTRLRNMQKAFEELMEVFDKEDLSLKENKEEFVKKCMSLTMECIKAHIFVATEYEEPIQRKEMRMECSQS